MKEKRQFIIPALLVGLVLATGCSSAGISAGQNEDVVMRTYTDDLGRSVELPEDITQIVPSGSLAQMFLFAAAADKLIAVSGAWSDDAADYLDEKYMELEEIGQFFSTDNLNYEEIAKLRPQVIIDVGERKDGLEENLDEITEKTGIPAVHIDAYLETYDETFLELGELLGEEEQGELLAAYCSQLYDTTTELMEQVDADGGRKKLLYLTGENGLNVIAKDSYHSAIIDLVSDNLAVLENPSSKGTGNESDMEQILVWNPEVIVFSPDSYYDYVEDDSVWMGLQAVQTGNYYETPKGPFNWMGFPPSCNRLMGMLWLTELLYPDYVRYDLEEETKEFYSLFYHCDLTTEQYEALVEKSILK